MTRGLTSIVRCDAAVWRRSISCYLWIPLRVVLVGQLWRGEKAPPSSYKATTLWFIWNRCFFKKEALHVLCSGRWLSQHPGLLTKTPKLSINKMIRRQEWKPWPHQTGFSGSYEHYKEEMSTHQPQCVSPFSLDIFLSLNVGNTWGGQSIKRHHITGFLFCPLRQWSQIQLLQNPESAKQDLQTKHI